MSPSSAIANIVIEALPGALFHHALTLLANFWPFLLLFVFISLVRSFFCSAKGKGHLGEAMVGLAVLKRLDSRRYRVFHDLYLPRPDGKGTTQIDHVVVSRHGIFVIETKNMTGWIFGDVNSRQWTQCLYGRKQRFQNPLHQNALHVKSLALFLGMPLSGFHNLVFFVGDATLKTDLPANVMTNGLRLFIQDRREEIIAPPDFTRVIEHLEAHQKGTLRSSARREHLLFLRKR
jgi:restriction system protein